MLSREQLSATAQQRVSARQSDVMVTARGMFEFECAREALCEARDNRLVLAVHFTRLNNYLYYLVLHSYFNFIPLNFYIYLNQNTFVTTRFMVIMFIDNVNVIYL